MDALTLSAVCIICAVQPAPALPNTAQWQPIIAEASTRFAMPENWIIRVMKAESAGRTILNGKPITSSAGAMGLMQVMPGTYADLRRQYGFGADPYAVRDNILAGTAYLRAMYERYGYPNLFAAYNAGPRRVDEFLLRGRPLPNATIAYVDAIVPVLSRVLGTSDRAPMSAAPHVGDALFVSLTTASEMPSPVLNPLVPETKSALVLSPESTSAAHNLFVPLSRPSP